MNHNSLGCEQPYITHRPRCKNGSHPMHSTHVHIVHCPQEEADRPDLVGLRKMFKRARDTLETGTHTHTHTPPPLHTLTHTHTHTHKHTHTHTHTHTQTHACTHAHTKISVAMETRQIPWRAIRPTLNLVAMTTLRNLVSCGMTS